MRQPRPAPGVIQGTVFHDAAYDGQFDSDDSPWAGVTVTLWTKLGQLATTTTDANGHYSFTAYPGHYNIQVATQPGYSFTPTGDSDVSTSGWSGFHELTTNGTLTLDAGLGIPPAPAPPVTITKCYTFGGQPVAMRKVVAGQPAALYYLHADHLGSTVLVTDRSGNAFETQQYHAYGRPRGGGALPTDSVLAALQIRAILLA
ncbi:MAG: hypothetical protein KDE54_21485 [Caldilineaceae bacterium]|nr:hypothetical protein [Caldilineaceae bacterium]